MSGKQCSFHASTFQNPSKSHLKLTKCSLRIKISAVVTKQEKFLILIAKENKVKIFFDCKQGAKGDKQATSNH